MPRDNTGLTKARTGKNDEFYTQYADIQKEAGAYLEHDPDVFRDKSVLLPCDDPETSNFTKFFADNFTRLGLKRLTSTCIAPEGEARGRILTMERGAETTTQTLLDGDGDFRSPEVTALRDKADIIMTNPPFSLFREFMAWLSEGGVKFSVIGNLNAVTYKEVFPLIQQDRIWLGASIHGGDRKFHVPDSYPLEAAGCGTDEDGRKYVRVKGVRWFTNIDHGRRHQPIPLKTAAENITSSRHAKVREKGYQRYDNYDAVEVPYTDAIPSDCTETMGVPVSWLDRHCPEQFEIIGLAKRGGDPALKTRTYTPEDSPDYSDLNAAPVIMEDGIPRITYARILIRRK